MACEAKCTHMQGCGYNLEGPPSFLAPLGPGQFPLLAGPVSVRNDDGRSMDYNEKCSRLSNEKEYNQLRESNRNGNDYGKCVYDAVGSINDEFRDVQGSINGERRYDGYGQLGEIMNGEINDMDPIGDVLCESNECGVKGEHCECEPGYCNADPAGDNLYCYEDPPMKAQFYMDTDDLSCDDNQSDKADNQIFILNMINHADVDERQACLARDDYGLNHESQVYPVNNDLPLGIGDSESLAMPASNCFEFESPENAVQQQNRQMVEGATVTLEKVKVAIAAANEMLLSLDRPRSLIQQDLLMDLEIHLGQSIRWLNDQVEELDEAIQQLLNEKLNLKHEIEVLIKDKNHLLEQPKSTSGLNTIERRQLELLGIDDVSNLINHYRTLQVQVLKLEAEKSRGVSRSSSKPSLIPPQKITVAQPKMEADIPLLEQQGGYRLSCLFDKNIVVKDKFQVDKCLSNAKIPQPQQFKGKTRVELQRFFRYFEPYAESLSLDDSAKALLVGYYLPKLQYQHDSLMQRNASYDEVKLELLNSFGSDSSAASYSLRVSLDKLVKPADKSYRTLLKEVEQKVAEAFCSDQNLCEQELKKILLRLTQEDDDTSYCCTILPYASEGYYRLKELVLGVEDANKVRRENAKQSFDHNTPERSFSDNCCGADSLPQDYYDLNTVKKSPKVYRKSVAKVKRKHAYNVAQKHSDVSFVENKRYSDTSTKGVKLCFVCGKSTHIAKDCSLRFAKKAIDDEKKFTVSGITHVKTVSEDPVKLFGDKTLLEAQFDGVKVNATLDSSSCVSVIDDKVLKGILGNKSRHGKITRERPETYKDMIGFVGANGMKLNVIDCVRIPIAWNNYEPSPALFFVVEGLQQNVLIGTNVLQGSRAWMHALEYALKAKTNFRENVNNVSCYCKTLIVKNDAQQCSKKMDTVTSNTTQFQAKKGRKRYRHLTSHKETESSFVHDKSNVNGMIKCFEPASRGRKRTYFNSNNVLARGSTLNNENFYQNALGLKKRYPSNPPADIESNWRNRDSVHRGYRTLGRNEYSTTLGNSKANEMNDFRDRKRNVHEEKPERPSSNCQSRDRRTIARTLFLSGRGVVM